MRDTGNVSDLILLQVTEWVIISRLAALKNESAAHRGRNSLFYLPQDQP